MATFLSIAQDVRAQSGISGTGPVNVENQSGIMADVVRWVVEAYDEIQTMYENWNFLFNSYFFTLQAGFDNYVTSSLVGDNGGEKGIRTLTKDSFVINDPLGIAKKERLRYIAWSVWTIDDAILEGKEGKPKFWTEDPSGRLHFYPAETVASGVDWLIEFTGFARPDVMTASTDIPIIPTQYTETIKLKALMRYAEYYNSPEVMQSASYSFQQQIKKMEYSELPRDNIITIPLV